MHQPLAGSFETIVEGALTGDQLGAIELLVVSLARRDADRGGWEASTPGRWRRMFRALTGLSGVRRLADERLEALRRFVCQSRRGDERMSATMLDMLAMGFSPEAIRTAAALALR